jgi:hypothetical protein
MRYVVNIKCTGEGGSIHRWWKVKRSNVVGFQLHREEGPAKEVFNLRYKWVNRSYYLRNHEYRNQTTWHNALPYKKYSKNNRGMI